MSFSGDLGDRVLIFERGNRLNIRVDYDDGDNDGDDDDDGFILQITSLLLLALFPTCLHVASDTYCDCRHA